MHCEICGIDVTNHDFDGLCGECFLDEYIVTHQIESAEYLTQDEWVTFKGKPLIGKRLNPPDPEPPQVMY